jgi:hypothetical protein
MLKGLVRIFDEVFDVLVFPAMSKMHHDGPSTVRIASNLFFGIGRKTGQYSQSVSNCRGQRVRRNTSSTW